MHIELTCVKYVCDWEIPVNHMLRRRAHAISISKADMDSDNDLYARHFYLFSDKMYTRSGEGPGATITTNLITPDARAGGQAAGGAFKGTNIILLNKSFLIKLVK